MARFDFKDSSFWPYSLIAKRERDVIENELNAIDLTRSDSIPKIQQFISKYGHSNLGIYSLASFENFFLNIAQTYDAECSTQYEPDTYLHVATWLRKVGGTARVIERWINNAPETEKHSLVIINEESAWSKDDIPQWLYTAVENKNGELITFDEGGIIERALRLRQMASKYDNIILHTQMEDPSALIAFGVKSFKRPVILFNHVDHIFWLGISIADMVADLRPTDFTTRRRHANQSQYLGLPVEKFTQKAITSYEKEAIRKELGIPKDAFVVVSTGTEPKYTDVGVISFRQMAQVVVAKTGGYFYLIGPGESKTWMRAKERTHGRVCPLGVIKDKSVYYKYLRAADVYINSYCVGGFTASLDAIQSGVPVLACKFSRQQDYLMWDPFVYCDGACMSEDELIKKICLLQQDVIWRHDIASRQLNKAISEFEVNWISRLRNILQNLPLEHKLHPFENTPEDSIINDSDVVNMNNYSHGVVAAHRLFCYFIKMCAYIKYHCMYIHHVHRYPIKYVKYDIKQLIIKISKI